MSWDITWGQMQRLMRCPLVEDGHEVERQPLLEALRV
jgi:hypothetical protein